MRTHATQLRLPRGFTFVELVMVVATVALVAAIAVPRMTNASQRYKADLAARRIAGDIELARQEAAASSSPRTVIFDAAALTYTIQGSAGLNGEVTGYKASLKQAPYEATTIRVKFAAVPPPTVLTYDGFGKPNAGASIIITAGGQSKTISVDPNTGRATIR